MNARLIARCLRRELREAFPNLRIGLTVKAGGKFVIKVDGKRPPFGRIRQIVKRWYRSAYGARVVFGKPTTDFYKRN